MPTDIKAVRNISNDAREGFFHLHNTFELYLFLSGEAHCLIEQSIYHLEKGTLLMFTNQEVHKTANFSSKTYDRILINFHPKVVESFSTEHTDLLACFLNRKNGQNNALMLSKTQLDIYLTLATKLIDSTHSMEYGNDVLSLTYLLQILIFLNKIYKQEEILLEQYPLSGKLQEVVNFIDKHLTQDLSLDKLGSHFSLDKSYLGRLFKKETGSTLYNFIVLKRIALAKQHLAEGKNVTETCTLSGFNDYSNFIRTFKQVTGYSPTQYHKLHS
jgi:YesN/AraC family two-component response regulator